MFLDGVHSEQWAYVLPYILRCPSENHGKNLGEHTLKQYLKSLVSPVVIGYVPFFQLNDPNPKKKKTKQKNTFFRKKILFFSTFFPKKNTNLKPKATAPPCRPWTLHMTWHWDLAAGLFGRFFKSSKEAIRLWPMINQVIFWWFSSDVFCFWCIFCFFWCLRCVVLLVFWFLCSVVRCLFRFFLRVFLWCSFCVLRGLRYFWTPVIQKTPFFGGKLPFDKGHRFHIPFPGQDRSKSSDRSFSEHTSRFCKFLV